MGAFTLKLYVENEFVDVGSRTVHVARLEKLYDSGVGVVRDELDKVFLDPLKTASPKIEGFIKSISISHADFETMCLELDMVSDCEPHECESQVLAFIAEKLK